MKETGVRYVGYIPDTGETMYAVPSKWGHAIPEPNARLIAAAPALAETLGALVGACEEAAKSAYFDLDLSEAYAALKEAGNE